jgi:hypothetical protein
MVMNSSGLPNVPDVDELWASFRFCRKRDLATALRASYSRARKGRRVVATLASPGPGPIFIKVY